MLLSNYQKICLVVIFRVIFLNRYLYRRESFFTPVSIHVSHTRSANLGWVRYSSWVICCFEWVTQLSSHYLTTWWTLCVQTLSGLIFNKNNILSFIVTNVKFGKMSIVNNGRIFNIVKQQRYFGKFIKFNKLILLQRINKCSQVSY